jgi:hypothetical protein
VLFENVLPDHLPEVEKQLHKKVEEGKNRMPGTKRTALVLSSEGQ